VVTHRHFIFALSLIAASSIAASCQAKKTPAENDADQQAIDYRKHSKWEEQPTGIKQEPVMVTQGPTPLLHLFDVGGPIRIIDLTSKSQLASATVPDRTLVRIDDRNGVTIGQERLIPGPLPAGHNYGIYLDPTTANVYRQGIGPPGDVPRQ
jgi:hypothetical protein